MSRMRVVTRVGKYWRRGNEKGVMLHAANETFQKDKTILVPQRVKSNRRNSRVVGDQIGRKRHAQTDRLSN